MRDLLEGVLETLAGSWIVPGTAAVVALYSALRPLSREISAFLRRRGLLARLSARRDDTDNKLHITLPDGDEIELSGFSEKALLEVLARVAPSERADAERRVREAAEREEAERRLAEYTRQRGEAEHWLGPYLPANVRRAKRLINHERLYVMIAEDRGVFGGTPPLTHQHLAKWVLIVEHWPRLGAALVRDPGLIDGLEQADGMAGFEAALDAAIPGVQSSEELFTIVHDGIPLRQVLSRLVRFEPAEQPTGTT